MIYKVTFDTNRLLLPIGYQTKVQGMLYRALSSVPEYSTFLHSRGYGEGNRFFKLFCFGQLHGGHVSGPKQLCFPGEMTLQLRTADPVFADILECSILRAGAVCQLAGQEIRVRCVDRRELVPEEGRTEWTIRMDSPMAIYRSLPEGKTRYFNPLEPEFPELVAENADRKFRAVFGAAPTHPITLTPLSVGARDKTVTTVKGIYVTAWGGTYLLRAEPQMLQLLYCTGLGAKNSMGFGLFDLV